MNVRAMGPRRVIAAAGPMVLATWAGAVASAVLAVAGLVVCTGTAGAVVNPVYDSTINVLAEGPVTTLDPAQARSPAEVDLVSALFEGLIRMGPVGPEPAAAESWSMSGDVCTFHLRPGYTFSNGAPVDAAAFIDSWQRAAGLAHPVAEILEELRPEALDSLSVRLTLSATNMGVLSMPWAFAVHQVKGSQGTSLLGSGPFRFAGTKEGAFLLAPRLDHHDGRPFAHLIHLRATTDPRIAAAAWNAGAVDIADSPPLPDPGSARVISRGRSAWLLLLNPRRLMLGTQGGAGRALVESLDRRRIAASLPGGPWQPISRFGKTLWDIDSTWDIDTTRAPAMHPPTAVPVLAQPLPFRYEVADSVASLALSEIGRQLVPAGFKIVRHPLSPAALDKCLSTGDFDVALLRWDAPRASDWINLRLAWRLPESEYISIDTPGPSPLEMMWDWDRFAPLFFRDRRLILRESVAGLQIDPKTGALRLDSAWISPWPVPASGPPSATGAAGAKHPGGQ